MQLTRKVRTVGLIGLLALVLVGGGLWWLLRDDAPDPVDLETAAEGVADDADGAAGVADGDGSSSGGDVSGAWAVDATSGEFDYESATGTFAGFRIEEELASVGSTTAVGRTGDVDGTMQIDGTSVTSASFTVDLTTLTTNDGRRDDEVQQALDTEANPSARFELTEPIELGDGAADGDAVTVTAVGDLTINGVTQRVEFPLEAQLVEGTVVVVGSIDVTFSDYDVQVPESRIVVSVEDHGTLELQILLTQAG